MKKKVIVWGYEGQMGQVVTRLLENHPTLEFVGGKDNNNSTLPETGADVIIDFSTPLGTMEMLKYAISKKIPAVIATTGITPEQEKTIKDASTHIPIFKSANMSFDIALFAKLLKDIANKLENTDVEISESHHNRKADSPSGTAKLLANAVNSGLSTPRKIVYGRQGKRNKDEIGIASLRGGNIVGEHTVYFFGEQETLSITHTSYSRNVFASGAIKAAEFLVSQPCGLYNMDDLTK